MKRRRWLVACLLGAVCRGAVQAEGVSSAPWNLDDLMAALAGRSHGATRFRERRESALLSEPLVIEGTFSYRAPDYLRKEVSKPFYSSFEIDAGRLRVDHGGRQPREIRLADLPPLRALVTAFIAVLAGDRAALERDYRARLSGDAASWLLVLEPLDSALAERVEHVQLSGAGGNLLEVVTLEAGGDRSVMKLDPISP